MIISRKSYISGKVTQRDIPIDEQKVKTIEEAFLILSKMSMDDKEFFLYGTPPEEWRKCVEEDL